MNNNVNNVTVNVNANTIPTGTSSYTYTDEPKTIVIQIPREAKDKLCTEFYKEKIKGIRISIEELIASQNFEMILNSRNQYSRLKRITSNRSGKVDDIATLTFPKSKVLDLIESKLTCKCSMHGIIQAALLYKYDEEFIKFMNNGYIAPEPKKEIVSNNDHKEENKEYYEPMIDFSSNTEFISITKIDSNGLINAVNIPRSIGYKKSIQLVIDWLNKNK